MDESQPEAIHLSEALISLGHVRHNAREVKAAVGKACAVMAIVKANGYGHGANEVATALCGEGITAFGVANINEAVSLRNQMRMLNTPAPTSPASILAFASPLAGQLESYVKHEIELTLGDFKSMRTAELIAAKFGRKISVHLKIDTGMGRLGVQPRDAMTLATAIEASPHLDLKAIYTHFASSGDDKTFTRHQLKEYLSLVREFEHLHHRRVVKHAANSGAVISDRTTHLDMVRPGVLLYGYTPSSKLKTSLDLRPAMQLQSRITFVKQIEKGTSVSYGRKWTAKRRTGIATVSIGYADGVHRSLSGLTKVSVRGRLYPQVGAVTMDQLMIDIGTDERISAGDTAVLFGWTGDGGTVAPSLNHLAERSGTIGYELLCAVSPRVKRVFID
ncbi:MAG: alanine racemase [Rhizobacter sp.]|nr:alanine racemase [Chlorobiales bacterium]